MGFVDAGVSEVQVRRDSGIYVGVAESIPERVGDVCRQEITDERLALPLAVSAASRVDYEALVAQDL